MYNDIMRAAGVLLVVCITTFLARDIHAQVNEPSTVIRILSPADGAVFKAPANIVVTIDGYDNPSTGHVIRLYQDGVVLNSVVLDPLIPITVVPVHFDFNFDWKNVPAGHYVLKAVIDNVESQPVDIIVKRKRLRHH